MTEEVQVLTLPKATTGLDAFPGLPWDVIARLRARGIRSVGGAVRAARRASGRSIPITRAIARMQADSVLDREAVHLLLMLQLAADLPSAPTAATPRKARRAERIAGSARP